jgi:hypothetical protein
MDTDIIVIKSPTGLPEVSHCTNEGPLCCLPEVSHCTNKGPLCCLPEVSHCTNKGPLCCFTIEVCCKLWASDENRTAVLC